jgi:hypothetical protein
MGGRFDLDWPEFSQTVLTTVAGAIALAVIFWLWKRFSKRPPLEWATLSASFFRLKEKDDFRLFGCVSVLLCSESNEVIKDVILVVSGEVIAIDTDSGVEASFVDGSEGRKIKVAALQPRKDVKIALFSTSDYITVKRVFVDHVEIDEDHKLRVSKYGELILPYWFNNLIIPVIFAVIFGYGIYISGEPDAKDASPDLNVEQSE